MTTNNFVYLNHWDQVMWTVSDHESVYVAECSIPWAARPDVKQWINKRCGGNVYCWNGVYTPSTNEPGGIIKTQPRRYKCFLVFENEVDYSLFLLTYAGRTDLEVSAIGKDLTNAYYSATY